MTQEVRTVPRLGPRVRPPAPRREEAKPLFSVVVPCFEEEGSIRKTIAELRGCLRGLEPYELIVVDDGSADGTPSILASAKAQDADLDVFTHYDNQGYGAALKTGIRASSGEYIVITDADGTYPNDRIPELLAAAEDVDMVVGARTSDEVEYPLLRKIPKVFMRAYAVWITRQDIPDLNSGMRVLRRSVVERFLNVLPDGFSFTTTITIAMMTNRYPVRYVPISYAKRVGRSKIRPVRDTLRFFQLILRTGMYFAPLRVYSPILWFMFVSFLASFGYDVFVLRDLTEKTLLLLMLLVTSTMFALLADMIDKRSH